jgi:hypothetical protein
MQTRPADEVHLFLSREPYLFDEGVNEIPAELRQIIEAHSITVQYVTNTGPYRKLLPLLKQRWDEDVTIVTVDDDTLYPPDFLEQLISAYERHRCIIAFAGRKVTRNSQGHLAPYADWPKLLPPENVDILNFPIGQSGVLYRPEFFTERVFDIKAMQLAECGDDIWYRGNTWLNEVRACIIGLGSSVYFPMVQRHPESLWKINRSYNDVQIQAVAHYLNLPFL